MGTNNCFGGGTTPKCGGFKRRGYGCDWFMLAVNDQTSLNTIRAECGQAY